MADDRLFHRSLGHGARIEALTDLEYRVWTQYVLSADDFGVMRYSYLPIQNGHAALAKRPAKTIQKALDAIVVVGLTVAFDHQGAAFLCQSNWQKYQKRTWTSRTMNPKPPADLLRAFEANTQHLFTIHPGGERVPPMPKASTAVIRIESEVSPDFIRTESRENPASREMLTLTLIPNANANAPDRRDEQWLKFQEAYPAHRREGGYMAQQGFLKACDELGFPVLMARLENQKRTEEWQKRMVPGMANYFLRELWRQEPTIPGDETLKKAEEHLAQMDAERAARRG